MRWALFILLLIALPAWAANESELVKKVEDYLNSLTTMSSDFTQVDPDGNVSGGKFYLKRTDKKALGKFKWEYDTRQPVVIISDGKQLIYYDKKLKEVTYTSLENQLAGFLAQPQIRLSGDIKLLSIEDKNGMIRAKLAQVNKPEQGSLTMFFRDEDMQISMLEVKDANGYVTKILFDHQRFGQKIPDKIFVFHDPKYSKNVWEKN